MDLRQRFAAKDTQTLIEILESSGAYTPDALKIARAELDARDIPFETLKAAARELVIQKAKDQMDRLDPLNDELDISASYFLDKTEVQDIYLTELKALMERKEGFRFDVWQYAIGGLI